MYVCFYMCIYMYVCFYSCVYICMHIQLYMYTESAFLLYAWSSCISINIKTHDYLGFAATSLKPGIQHEL